VGASSTADRPATVEKTGSRNSLTGFGRGAGPFPGDRLGHPRLRASRRPGARMLAESRSARQTGAMRGPLDSAMYDTRRWPESWWLASAPAWAEPAPLDGEAEAEVAIIGGGYAGLACAIRLAERGIGAVVLDAGPIGWGASGRNGGMAGLASH